MTSEEIAKMVAEASRVSKSFREALRGGPEPTPRVGQCKVCHGKITERFYRQPLSPDIIGPGHGAKWVSSGLSCQDCGIQYTKLPFSKEG